MRFPAVAPFVSTWSTPTPKVAPEHRSQLRVGRLTKAHGLKGALKIELYTDEPDKRFVPGAIFTLQVPEESPWHGKNLTLAEMRWYNGTAVGFFVDVDDRTQAETLARAILWIDVDTELSPDEPDAWYDHQLVGLTVMRDGTPVGTVSRVDHFPAQDLLVVATDKGEVMVPFVSAIVPAVDIAAKTVTVTPPGGLFEDLDDEPASDEETAAETANQEGVNEETADNAD